MPMCPAKVRPTVPPAQVNVGELWQAPEDVAGRDLVFGPWGAENAPDGQDTYTFVRPKTTGANPGVVVNDSRGREWHVKQPREGVRGDEGPAEVVLSRVLSAVGYHQPPVYYLKTFTVSDESGTHTILGGRFRLHAKFIKNRSEWSWQQNPFVGTRPYNGLLVILMMFNSSDLKNSNNSIYEVKRNGQVEQWYAVRDLGTALGATGHFGPPRNNIDLFEKPKFILKVDHGFVRFDYDGWQQELVRHRITPDDVRWASDLLAGLSDRQWQDAFRTAGYEPAIATRFIARLRQKIEEGRHLSPSPAPTAP